MHPLADQSRLLLVSIFLCFSGTVHSDLADDEWLRLISDSFELVTNLDLNEAQELVREVQRFQPISARFIPVSERSRPPLKMLVFRSRSDFVEVTKPRHFAAFTQPELKHTLLVIAPSGGRDSLLHNTRHEYAHYQLRSAAISYPLWYEEGMATMLGTTDISVADGMLQITTDATPRILGRPLLARDRQALKLEEILFTQRVDTWPYPRVAEFYRRSSQLVHFFTFGHERGFPDRRAGLARHFENRSRSIYEALDVSKARLRREFSRYVRNRRVELVQLPLEVEYEIPQIDQLPRKEVLVLLALAAEDTNRGQAIRYLEELKSLEPDNAAPLVELSRLHAADGDLEASSQYLERARALATHDAGVLIQEAALAIRNCWSQADECLEEWRRAAQLSRAALDLDPSRMDGIYLLGISELYTGNPGRAVNYLRVVYERAPWSPRLNFHYGECLRLIGDRRASNYLVNARDWAESDTWRELAESALGML